ncbi:MAG: hypothetical protein F6K24_24775 [Okeania sp. SIO2D1]|nr:hypothetical protein [Okeania sp. SIO2D1]
MCCYQVRITATPDIITNNTKKHTMQALSGRYAVYLLVGNSPPVIQMLTGDPLPTSKLEKVRQKAGGSYAVCAAFRRKGRRKEKVRTEKVF